MIPRRQAAELNQLLRQFPVVGLMGSRQSGKTTLAKTLRAARRKDAPPVSYLDLELPSDLARLDDPELYFRTHADGLVILDEVQRRPDLFPVIRAIVDADPRPGRFLALGSASPDLLHQESESLAGRIAWIELPPLLLPEILGKGPTTDDIQTSIWLRGGYPPSFLAPDAEASMRWRRAFIEALVGRDIPSLGIRTPVTKLRRFLQMVAHMHGGLWRGATLANSLDVSEPTVRSWLDLLTDLCLVRQLAPRHANLKKRLVKAPKVYLRDSGLLHAVLGLEDLDALQGHPTLGASFEGFVIEQILALLPPSVDAAFYRTHGGAEVDLVLQVGPSTRIGIEVKHASAPKFEKGLRNALADTACTEAYVVVPCGQPYALAENVTVVPLPTLLEKVILPIRHGTRSD